MGELVIRGNLSLATSPGNGDGDAVLARDASTGAVGLNTTALSTALTSAQIIVGNASNIATAVTVTGDVTISNTGVTSIGSGVIVNADINGSAGIVLTKLAATTASRALVSDGSGFIIPATTTATEIGYVNGVTSSIQTQIDGKQATITGAATTVVSSNLTSNTAVISNGSGKLASSAVTSTELGYLTGVTSAIQTQMDTKLAATITSAANGDIVYYNGASWVNLPRGTNGQTLQSTATTIQWGTVTANGLTTGGTINQYLKKNSGTDYDASWDTLTLSDVTDVTATAGEVNVLAGAGITDVEVQMLQGAASNLQTQLNSKLGTTLTQNKFWIGNVSNVATESNDLPTGTTIGSSAIYRVGGTDVSLADGGTGASLADPGFDAVYVWDNTLNQTRLAELDGLTYDSGTNTITAAGGGGSVTSVSGTANRITSTGGTTPVIDIAATYVGQASITTLGTIATGVWQGTVVGVAYGGTGLSSYTAGDIIYATGATTLAKLAIGTAGQLLKVNAGATAVEYFTPTYISGNQTITLSGDVSGSGTTSITTAIGANKVLDTMIRQSAGLSLIGRSANSTGDVADITAGTDNQVLRRSGTSIAFGAVNLASSNAVTGTLAIGNGGTGSTAGAWLLSGSSILSGVATVTSNTANQHVFDGTWTATANNQYHLNVAPTITARATSADNVFGWRFQPAFTFTATNQEAVALELNATYSGVFAGTSSTALKVTTGGIPSFKILNSGQVQFYDSAGTSRMAWSPSGYLFANGDVQTQINPQTETTGWGFISGTKNTTGSMFSFRTGGSQLTAGTLDMVRLTTTGAAAKFNPSSGTAAFNIINATPIYEQTGTASGTISFIDYNPTETAVLGTHYGIRVRPTSALNSFGVATPTAVLDIAASTTSRASLRIRSGTAPTSPNDGDIWYDGSNYLARSTASYTLAKTLTATATLDFPSTNGQNSSDLTITVTGAASGDVVMVGVPNGSVIANSCYTAWVSAADTVTVRFNNYDTVAADPASNTFRVSVIKY